ncbi:hypothetical protein HQ590_13025 [bacterium]|nr:hypothetical protein [bacterium]
MSAPPAPPPKSLRFALTLNLFLPGAGQLYLGQTILGTLLAAGFLGCFAVMLGLFLRGYKHYLDLSTGGQVLEGDNLEQLAQSFHVPWLVGLLIVAIGIYLTSVVSLGFARHRR